jgi:hypothetical protein
MWSVVNGALETIDAGDTPAPSGRLGGRAEKLRVRLALRGESPPFAFSDDTGGK